MEIGKKLKEARLAADLTLEQAAQALYVSRQTISNWENEKAYPDIVSVIKLSDLYCVSLDGLLKGDARMLEHLEELDRVGFQVEDFGGTDALVFREDSEYMTRVYCYEGWLMELYASQELEMKPADGERIMELSGLEMALEDGRLTLTVTGPEGGASSLVLSLRSGEGAAA